VFRAADYLLIASFFVFTVKALLALTSRLIVCSDMSSPPLIEVLLRIAKDCPSKNS
jgi:hypothetical protein